MSKDMEIMDAGQGEACFSADIKVTHTQRLNTLLSLHISLIQTMRLNGSHSFRGVVCEYDMGSLEI